MSSPGRQDDYEEPTTLPAWLRACSDDDLTRLFELRPDLATPPPPDFDILAARLEIRVSVLRALDTLDMFTLEVGQALTLAPPGVSPRRLAEICGGLDVGPAVAALRDRGLLWGTAEAPRLVGMARDLLGDRPLGLGRPVRDCLAGYRPPQLARLVTALGASGSSARRTSRTPARPERLADLNDQRSRSGGKPGSGGNPAADPAGTPGRADPGSPVAATSRSTAPDREELVDVVSQRLADADLVRRLAAECSPAAGRILDRLAAGPARGATAEAGRLLSVDAARTPVEELLARGLLVGVDADEVEMPREVGIALRGAAPTGPLHPEPPELTGAAVDPASVDPAAALAADAVVRQVATLLEAWGAAPVVPLRTGGLSVRDLRAAARLLDVPEPVAAFVVELAAATGLVDSTGGVDARIVPTTLFDRWGVDDPARRWAALVEGWARSTAVATLVGERDERGRQISALSVDVRRPAAPATRAEVLTALAAAPAGVAPAPADVRALLAWRAPRRGGPLLERLIDATLREAELLGLTGRGVPATTGRLLAELLAPAGPGGAGQPGAGRVGPPGPPGSFADALADALAPLLPEPVEELLLQGDLTAVAPGPLVPEVAAQLALLADIESAGAATVYRFSEESLRRALDAGVSPADIHDLLARLGRGGVPQALTYLVDDTARRHGRLRSGPAESYLRCDDAVLLSEVVASRRTQTLGLRRIAPTVVISRLPVPELLDGLRAAGFAPAAEGADGRVLVSRPQAHRTPARARSAAADPAAVRRGQLRDAVRLVRRGDESARALRLAGIGTGANSRQASRNGSADPAGGGPDGLVRSAPMILVSLQAAVRERRRVLLGYVDAQGKQSDRIVRPTSVEGGWLTAWDETVNGPSRFVLHRVTGVADITDPFDLPGTSSS
ncbi:helicase-associated domain-containing protein [Frankia sp. CNm7]|uniref:Helicase-associated domain-containing protein n=1 Tax=Frankia nepalensis TaxID=1836974 RepID=A0A937RLY3_9ACTN|nr:helicase-associated domain-containing protein [Frankia nepalensis]MBL7502088.1 helicase-associated domain-containing protein [Frankia nepalensis]MBL7512679.1 helicase-associated domain-containing protein [Frankia nepalensis]MBL7520855.1 helicase-associated domain-containing protein [Frankia nepalensis]MBL7631330.1 helicase-associated domain-containing protein [Frankia nepalensis]